MCPAARNVECRYRLMGELPETVDDVVVFSQIKVLPCTCARQRQCLYMQLVYLTRVVMGPQAGKVSGPIVCVTGSRGQNISVPL